MGRLSQTESLVLEVSCVVALGTALWIVGRQRSTEAFGLVEPAWALVAALVVLAITATVWLGV